jgi:hypothetical protein
LKAKLWLFFAFLLFTLSFMAIASAQTEQVYFKEDFNYSSLDQMQAAGWTFTRPAGISVGSGAVVLDGTGGDCAIHYNNHFSTGIFDWKVESKSMWLGQGHTTNGVYVSTERHSYSFSADGYYDEFAFYRDNVKILRFGSYQETANQYFVMTMVREANIFSLYFNGELKNTYTEEDTQQSAATGIALVSPWKGDAKYDYYQIGAPTTVFSTSAPTSAPASTPASTNSFSIVPVLVGVGIAATVIGGLLYYFFFTGVSSASAGSPLSGEAPLSPLDGQGALIGEQVSNITQSMSIVQDLYQTLAGGNMSAISAIASGASTTIQILPGGNTSAVGADVSSGDRPSTSNSSDYHYQTHGGLMLPPNQDVKPLFDTLMSQGQQLVNEGTTQNSIDQGSCQQYLENCTNMLDMLTNIVNTQQQTNLNIIQNIDGGGNPAW